MIDRSVRAEAAAWLARLRSEERSPADETAFRDWLARNPMHGVAFEDLSAAWDTAGAYVRDPARMPSGKGITRRRALGAGAGAAVAAAATGMFVWTRTDPVTRYTTGPGERRQLVLADHSQVTLDSDSILAVSFSRSARRLTLERGRAFFDVAHDPARPFITRAGDHEVIALGTMFEVDHDPAGLSVMLVEGKVAVRSDRAEAFMRAGDRLIFRDAAGPLRDRPDMARLTAWQRGQLVFDNDRLMDAVAQMGRYSSRPLIVDPSLRDRRVSGAFTTSDPAGFAQSVGILLDVPVVASSGEIRIGRNEAPDSMR